MHGLAIDSTHQTASAALWQHDGSEGPAAICACGELDPSRDKADQLILVVERLLGEQGWSYRDLDVIAVGRGPGSFTGIRSAVALGRGLALAAGRPVFGVTSLDAVAALAGPDVTENRSLLVVLDARRGEVYSQRFDHTGKPLDDIRAETPKQAAADLRTGSWRVAGSGASMVLAALGAKADTAVIETPSPTAETVARTAAVRLAAGEAPAQGFELRPLYVRAPDAAVPAPLIRPVTSTMKVPV